MRKIRKAVFPVAGLGTRFLPATKASPKEMMPVVDKPLIQYAVEEAVAAGIDELIFITSGAKRAIEDHFDKNYELETKLELKGKKRLLRQAQSITPPNVNCVYVRQQEALGLGHAVLCAEHLINPNEYFAVLLADDLIKTEGKGCLAQMIDVQKQHQSGVLAVQTVAQKETDQYGIVVTGQDNRIEKIVEKPSPDRAPSKLGVVGRYILPASIFKHLRATKKGSGGEIQLTDAIAALLAEHPVMAHAFEGVRYDCGSKLGYLQANVEFGVAHEECGAEFKRYLKKVFC